jgi:hypothetical protein
MHLAASGRYGIEIRVPEGQNMSFRGKNIVRVIPVKSILFVE